MEANVTRRCRMRSRPTKSSEETQIGLMLDEEEFARSCRDHSALSSSQESSNLVWRSKVAQWFYDVVDQLGESRDIVFIAMNVLDRFCVVDTSAQYSRDEKAFEAAAMTGLFMGLKLCGRRTFGASDVTRMSNHGTDMQDIVRIGKSMINLLSWNCKVHTPLNFARALLRLLPSSVDDGTKRVLLESASYLVEVSVCDSFFSGLPSSQIAYAAILNATGSDGASQLTSAERDAFHRQVQEIASLEHDSTQVRSVRSRLLQIYLQSDESNQAEPQVIPETDRGDVARPVLSKPVSIRVVSSDNMSVKPVVRSHAVNSLRELCPSLPRSPPRSPRSRPEMSSPQENIIRKRAVSPSPMCQPETKRTRKGKL